MVPSQVKFYSMRSKSIQSFLYSTVQEDKLFKCVDHQLIVIIFFLIIDFYVHSFISISNQKKVHHLPACFHSDGPILM